MLPRLISILGMLLIIGSAFLFSSNRKKVSWRIVIWGTTLQIIFALLILKTTPGMKIFQWAQIFFNKIYEFTGHGTQFLIGQKMSEVNTAVSICAVLIFISSLMAILYYLRVIQVLVYAMAKLMKVTMKISGAESLGAAMFIFMGIEAITGLKKFIREMTSSELLTIMTGFMATIAGTVMAIYVGVFGAEAGHLLAASIMSAPAAIMLSKILLPETEVPATSGDINWKEIKSDDVNVIDAAASGASDGMKLSLNIAAMLLAFVAIIGMLDSLLTYMNTSFGEISGYLLSPVAFIMGVPWSDCLEVGKLLGIKVVFNEFISYQQLQQLAVSGTISPRSITIATYALCSFANFGSLAILIGGIGGLCPERKRETAKLGIKALFAGFLAGCMTATVAGFLLNS
ncbi:MAG TPA: nucleoside transporter C-terminal domain-containing protein [bacterium]|nr:nucleoside transporter C-terminal domain-containing protein [bacterium]